MTTGRVKPERTGFYWLMLWKTREFMEFVDELLGKIG
jgi:hypothetical protein